MALDAETALGLLRFRLCSDHMSANEDGVRSPDIFYMCLCVDMRMYCAYVSVDMDIRLSYFYTIPLP